MAEDAAPVATATEEPIPAGGADTGGGDVAASLEAFEEKFIAEYTGTTPPAKDEGGEGGVADAEPDAESPADEEEAGAASDDDSETPPHADPVASELAQLREALEALRAERSGTGNALEAVIADSPEIQQLDTALRDLQADATQAERSRQAAIAEYNKATTQIARLEGKLEAAADVDKLDIRDELRAAKNGLSDQEDVYKRALRTLNDAEATRKALLRQRTEVVEGLKGHVAQQQSQAQANERTKQEARLVFGASFLEGAKKYGIDPESKAGARIRETIKAHVTLKLRTLQAQDPNAPKADLKKLIAREWAAEAEARKLAESTRFAAASTARRESDAGKAVKGTRLPTNSSSRIPKDLVNDASFWKARAAKLVGEA